MAVIQTLRVCGGYPEQGYNLCILGSSRNDKDEDWQLDLHCNQYTRRSRKTLVKRNRFNLIFEDGK